MNTSLYRTSLALIHQQYKPLVSFIPLNTLQLWFLIMGIMLLHYNVVVLVLIMFACRLTMCSSSNAKDSRLCIERERQALLAFKQSLSDPYKTLSSWSGQDCCRWDGVFCNNITGRIMKLDLSNKGLIGSEVSSSLSELNHLEDLDLTRNNFSASKIPSFFGNFKSLRSLNLSDASFAGGVPPSLGNISTLQELNLGDLELLNVDDLHWLSHLSNLRTLDLSSVDLSQVYDLPQVLNSFPFLSDLYLEGCNLAKFPLSSLSNANLTNVRTLDLFVNHFTGDLPDLLTQLPSIQMLDLSSNSFSGLTPSFFPTKSSTLSQLFLDSNQLNGSIPERIGQLSNLQILSLGNNSLSGSVSEIHFEKLPSLKVLDMSSNSLAMNVSTDWVPPFQLRDLYLESCKFENGFPRWLLTQKSIEFTAIPNASISGSIPQNIGNMMPNLVLLILSHNNISGSIPTSLCGMRNLTLLDIAHNHLSGDLPENCWSESRFMMILDLSFNSLTGLIPRSVGNLSSLISLHLNNNKFYGELPVEMENCKSLSFLDLGKNGFSGNLPAWIKGLEYLRILNLRSNNFGGTLVQDLCAVSELQFLNLAGNNISGTIPSCFGNFNGMTQGGNMGISRRFFTGADSLYQIMNGRDLDGIFRRFFIYSGSVILFMNGREFEYGTILVGRIVNLDLASNNLVGHIPEELTSLSGLSGLNLSRNRLTGLIPEKIGDLEFLDSLDFSHNHLTGIIPQSISKLLYLSYLNFAYNNLSGRISTGGLLEYFDPSMYEGNQGLCGVPIEKECAKDESFQFIDDDGEANEETKKFWFYIGLFIGFVVGFWGVCGVLFFKTTWRHSYFRFIEGVYEMLIVKILIYASLVEKKF